jgi:hypothetical protein
MKLINILKEIKVKPKGIVLTKSTDHIYSGSKYGVYELKIEGLEEYTTDDKLMFFMQSDGSLKSSYLWEQDQINLVEKWFQEKNIKYVEIKDLRDKRFIGFYFKNPREYFIFKN